MKGSNMTSLFLLIFVIHTGCSQEANPVQIEGKYVHVNISEQTLIVQNRGSESAYYFVAERNGLPNIEWEPYLVSEENKISPSQRQEVRLEEIPGYTESSETLLFYYWYESGREKNEMYGYTLTIN